MASLDEFLALLAARWPDASERGTRFESYLCEALRASPSHQFTNVWLWDDWPGRDGPDYGIDLVATDADGGLWGIQSKLYDPDASLTWKELSTWVAATRDDPWTHRLLVSTSSNLSRNAERELLGDSKTLMLLGADLFSLPVEWPAILDAPIVRVAPMVPRPHQVEAIDAICAGLDGGASRVQTHMACGTGKTLVGLRVFEQVAPDLAVVLVPSLSLMAQTIRSWTANAIDEFRYLPVCSDVKVTEDGRRGEDADLTTGDLAMLDAPATTDPDEIGRFLTHPGRRVVFCTYQSSDVLAAAALAAGVRFGLVVADEAHRTTGATSSVFSTVLDDGLFPADRRVFVTATPRIFAATDDGDETVRSMDNPDLYGDCVYELGFGRAVELGLLADYEVVVVAVANPDLRARILEDGSLELDGLNKRVEASALVALEGTLQAIDEFGMSRLISFHSRIKRAKDFADAVPVFQQWREHGGTVVEADTVNGTMNTPERKKRISRLEHADQPRVLTNARCLTEGIDVPSLDGIVFADPRRSQTDIVQAVGRVMRTDPNNPDKVGRIIIPVVVPDPNADGDNVFNDSAFKPVWDVIRALKAHDFRLETELNQLRGLTAIGPISQQDFRQATRLNVIGVNDLDAFQLAIINHTTPTFWWWLNGPLQQFVDREGHARVPQNHLESFKDEDLNVGGWVGGRRKEWRKGRLSPERAAALEAVPGWEWDAYEAGYQQMLEALQQFVDREGHALVPRSHLEPFKNEDLNLGSWVSNGRTSWRKGRLSPERAAALEAVPGWGWSAYEADHQRMLKALQQFIDREGHARVPASHLEPCKDKHLSLGRWVSKRRGAWQNGKLSPKRAAALEGVAGWEWDANEASYQRMLKALQQFIEREGHARIPTSHLEPFKNEDLNLGSWARSRRAERRNGKLSPAHVAALEALPGWEWEAREAIYQRGLDALRQFVEREGHTRVPKTHVEGFDGEDLRLGGWLNERRHDWRNNKLSHERAAALEALPGWEWEAREAIYQRGLDALRQFVEREGHTRIPRSHIEPFKDEDLNLGSWARSRRVEWRSGKLSPDRAAVLGALGMVP